MKKNDITVIIVTAIFACIVSVVLSSIIFTPKQAQKLKAQKIDPISSDFQQVDRRYFNSQSVNPTQVIQIGDNQNKNPL